MSFSELLFVLLMVCLLVGIAVVAHMVGTANRRAEAQARELAEVRAQLALGNQERDSSSAEVREVRVVLEGVRAAVAAAIEKEVERRVREVSQYIDPDTTAPFSLAAVPDGAYSVCRAAFAEAHRRHVIIVGYSMVLPYLLTLYQLHLQFSRSVDLENLQACMMEVERQLDGLESTLENKLQRALTMLGNTYTDGKQSVARIRASVHSIQAMERLPEAPSLALVGEGIPSPLPTARDPRISR